MAKEDVRARSEVVGTTAGLIVFFVGVGLLITVFMLAFRLFGDPGILTAAAAAPPAKAGAGGAPALTGALVGLVARILFLFVMVLAGSLVASKGVHLYLASR